MKFRFKTFETDADLSRRISDILPHQPAFPAHYETGSRNIQNLANYYFETEIDYLIGRTDNKCKFSAGTK